MIVIMIKVVQHLSNILILYLIYKKEDKSSVLLFVIYLDSWKVGRVQVVEGKTARKYRLG